MLDAVVRPLKDLALAPLTRVAARVHPNAITVAALLAGMACAGAAATGSFGLALGFWALNRVLDGLDGTVARRADRQTDLGGYLDLVFDFVVYAAIPLGIAVAVDSTQPGAWPAAAVLLACFYINAASWMVLAAVLEKRSRNRDAGLQTSIVMPEGLIAGTETVLFYTAFLLLPSRASTLFLVMAGLVLITAGQRVVMALRSIS